MTSLLETSWRSDRALASLEADLIRQARDLYRLGFKCISPSQMSAFGELLRSASNRTAARQRAKEWMAKQLEKLRQEEKRKGKPRSWLASPEGGSAASLGEELLAWIDDERYLGENPPQDLDRLEALRRFWARLHGFYRYEVETETEMPLTALDFTEGGEPR